MRACALMSAWQIDVAVEVVLVDDVVDAEFHDVGAATAIYEA